MAKNESGSTLPVKPTSGAVDKIKPSGAVDKIKGALIPELPKPPAPVAKVAVGTYRWVERKPSERIPIPAAVGVYATGAVLHLAQVSPLMILPLPFGAAGIAWATTFKLTNGNDSRASFCAAAVFAAGSWLTAATQTGVLWGPHRAMTLTFMVLFAVLYGVHRKEAARYRKVEVVPEPEPEPEPEIDRKAIWREVTSKKYNLEGTFLLNWEETRLGERYVIDVHSSGKRASQVASKNLEEHIAAVERLPRVRVSVSEDKIAGRVVISIRRRDPWQNPIPHPLLVADHEIKLPRIHDVLDPITIGQDPETGAPLNVEIVDKEEGANRIMVIGASGGGKSVLVNNILERLTACGNVMVCCIDLAKAKEIRRFRRAGALGPSACGPEERAKALRILEMAEAAIVHRAAQSEESDDAVFVPRPGAPAIILVLDEIDALFAYDDRIAAASAKALKFLTSKGRSEMVGTIMIGQRGTARNTGGGDNRANSNVQIFLKVRSQNEMNLAGGDQTYKIPNMGTYGEGHPGVAAVVKGDSFSIGRSFKLRELNELSQIAEGRWPSQLEPGLLGALGEKWTKLATGHYDAEQVAARRAETGQKSTARDTVPMPPPLPQPDAAPAPGAAEDYMPGGVDEDGGEDDVVGVVGEDIPGSLNLLDEELENSLPEDLRSAMEDRMGKSSERIAGARAILNDVPELPEVSPEMEAKLRASAQERNRQMAANTEIAPEHMAVLRQLLGREGGASTSDVGRALGIASRTNVWRVMKRLEMDGIAFLRPPKGRHARWRLTPDALTPRGHGA